MAVPTQAGIFSVGALTSSIRQGNDIDIKTAEAFDSLSNSGNALLARIAAVESTLSGQVPVSGLTIADIIAAGFRRSFVTQELLTTATRAMTYADPDNAGDLLSFGVLQDATGGRQITWGTNLLGASVVLDPTAGTLSLFQFVGRVNPTGGLLVWFLSGVPNLGIVI